MRSPEMDSATRTVMSEAWKTIAMLAHERDRLLRGEFICQRCGLRKDDENPKTHEF